jgi:hypothetical protein
MASRVGSSVLADESFVLVEDGSVFLLGTAVSHSVNETVTVTLELVFGLGIDEFFVPVSEVFD